MPLSRFKRFAVRPLAVLLAAAWGYKAITTAVGLRRLTDLRAPAADRHPPGQPALTVIVPACNEEASVAACLRSLLAQDYPALQIVAVDDRSTDHTGALVDSIASAHPDRLTALHVTELPPGWLGKTHAMAMAARFATVFHRPAWLLFTDADVVFHPECLRRSLAEAEHEQADHFVTLPTAEVHSLGEGIILGFLQVIGFWATRLWRVADPAARDAMGIGAFNLLRASAYARLGGFEQLRMEIVEDLALARRVKLLGLRQRIAIAPGYVSLHWARGLRGVLNTMTKNLFAIFGYRPLVVMAGCFGLLALCLGPALGLLWGATRLPSAIAVLAIVSLYAVARRLSAIPVWNAVMFPVSCVLFVYAAGKSAVVTLQQGGVTWRGTFYPLAQLRRGSTPLLLPSPPTRNGDDAG